MILTDLVYKELQNAKSSLENPRYQALKMRNLEFVNVMKLFSKPSSIVICYIIEFRNSRYPITR